MSQLDHGSEGCCLEEQKPDIAGLGIPAEQMDLPCCSMPRILIETPASGFARHATITISSVMIIIHYPELLAS